MDLWDAIHEQRTQPCDFLLLDERGRTRARLPEVMMSGFECRALSSRARSNELDAGPPR